MFLFELTEQIDIKINQQNEVNPNYQTKKFNKEGSFYMFKYSKEFKEKVINDYFSQVICKLVEYD